MFYRSVNIEYACFHRWECEQLVNAAKKGRADDIFALVAEGANTEFKDRLVRSLCLFA